MAVRKVNERWVVEYQQAGRRVFKRLPEFAGKSDAQALETKLRREGWERSALGIAEEPSLGEAITAWLKATHPGRKDKLNPARNAVHLEPFVRGKTLRDIGACATSAIQAWRSLESPATGGSSMASTTATPYTARKRARASSLRTADGHGNLSPATVNRRLDILRAASRWAWKQGLIAEDLSGRVPRLREENARQVYLTASQVKTLAECGPNPTIRSAIYLAAYTGLRASELLSLGPVPKRASTLSVQTSKSSRPRIVPIAKPLSGHVSALPLGCSYRLLIKWFHAARKKAGMRHVHFHDLRHSCASMLINAGVDLYTVGKILGHSSPLTTARYSHLSQATLQKAMRRLK